MDLFDLGKPSTGMNLRCPFAGLVRGKIGTVLTIDPSRIMPPSIWPLGSLFFFYLYCTQSFGFGSILFAIAKPVDSEKLDNIPADLRRGITGGQEIFARRVRIPNVDFA